MTVAYIKYSEEALLALDELGFKNLLNLSDKEREVIYIDLESREYIRTSVYMQSSLLKSVEDIYAVCLLDNEDAIREYILGGNNA